MTIPHRMVVATTAAAGDREQVAPAARSSYGCHTDTECGGTYVCARDGECLTPTNVRDHPRRVDGRSVKPRRPTSCATAPTPLELRSPHRCGVPRSGSPRAVHRGQVHGRQDADRLHRRGARPRIRLRRRRRDRHVRRDGRRRRSTCHTKTVRFALLLPLVLAACPPTTRSRISTANATAIAAAQICARDGECIGAERHPRRQGRRGRSTARPRTRRRARRCRTSISSSMTPTYGDDFGYRAGAVHAGSVLHRQDSDCASTEVGVVERPEQLRGDQADRRVEHGAFDLTP